MSVADDGGSSGRLRELLQSSRRGTSASAWWRWPSPGRCWPRPSSTGSARRSWPATRSGNLILAGLIDGAPDPVAALDEACRLLGVRGRVLPATTEPVVLKAEADGGQVDGQVAVMATDHIRTGVPGARRSEGTG